MNNRAQLYQLSILPLSIVAVGVITVIIMTKKENYLEMMSMSNDEFSKVVIDKAQELYFNKYLTLLNILATISWILIIKWLLL